MDHSGHNHMMMETTTMAMSMNNDHMHMGHMSPNTTAVPSMGGMDHSMHGAGDPSAHMDMMGMMMYFHTGFSEYILFKDCQTKSEGAMVGACFVIFFVAILYEGLKFLREMLLQRSMTSRPPYLNSTLPPGSSQEQMVLQLRHYSVMNRMLNTGHIVQTLLHVVQVFVSYCLMLVFMTYNVWLCLSIVLGAGFGYFLFGWKRAVVVDSNEHCH